MALPLATCVQRRRYANRCAWTLVGLHWQGKTDVLGKNPVLAPNCPPQISQRPAVTGRRHMWHMAGPSGVAVRLTLLWYHGVYVTPVLFDSRFFFKLSRIYTDIAFYIFFRKAFLTMSHTFASC